ncbi:sulfurtransferase [Pelomonas sp. KK5]|uniref:sulfurtransferase n=1 Tax=Pelomonas sp. KK5 TaxID=1855730 RepID=UPI001302004F|nr:rhodanese-like domain-containing protein [Pelomonas sp. KK5]
MTSRMPAAAATLALLLLTLAGRSFAAPSVILDTEQVEAARQHGALVWDVRGAGAWRQGHIPGAVNIDEVTGALRNDNTEDYLPLPEIERKLGRAGIDPQREIVVYGPKGAPGVYFALVTLQYFGATKALIYHGGIDDWMAAGKPVTAEATVARPVTLKLGTRPELLVDTKDVIARLKDPSVQILDVRTPAEFRGEDIRAIRGGHIPGAIAIDYQNNQVDPDAVTKFERRLVANKDGLNLKSRDELKKLYSALDPDKETIVYCQSGVRASETATVLQEIGFTKVKVYDSSWLGYGNTLAAPAEDVSFVNVGMLTGRLSALQKRLDAMEKEMAAMKAAKP